jgi:hypothetical protein
MGGSFSNASHPLGGGAGYGDGRSCDEAGGNVRSAHSDPEIWWLMIIPPPDAEHNGDPFSAASDRVAAGDHAS